MRTISWTFVDMACDIFEIYPDESGKFRCRLRASDSGIIPADGAYRLEASYTMIDKKHFVKVTG